MLRRFLLSLALLVRLSSPALARGRRHGGRADDLAAARLSRGRLRRRGPRRQGGQRVGICRNARVLGLGRATRSPLCRPIRPRLRWSPKASGSQSLIEPRRARDEVASAAHALGQHLLAAYPVPLGPKQAPDLARGDQLFQQNCASCHGAKGDAQTAMARQLDPPPIAFADRATRQAAQPVRSVPGDQPGPRRHGDAELRAAARRRQMGARLPCRPLRLSRCASSARQGDLGQGSRRSGPRSPT